MKNSPKLTKLFNKFVGKEVPMIEKKVPANIGCRIVETTQVSPADPKDPVLEEMKKTAEENGLKLRVWWPGVSGTKDLRNNRVNAHIAKASDGKYRVTDDFQIY